VYADGRAVVDRRAARYAGRGGDEQILGLAGVDAIGPDAPVGARVR
jgi:hypothetical protein